MVYHSMPVGPPFTSTSWLRAMLQALAALDDQTLLAARSSRCDGEIMWVLVSYTYMYIIYNIRIYTTSIYIYTIYLICIYIYIIIHIYICIIIYTIYNIYYNIYIHIYIYTYIYIYKYIIYILILYVCFFFFISPYFLTQTDFLYIQPFGKPAIKLSIWGCRSSLGPCRNDQNLHLVWSTVQCRPGTWGAPAWR